MSNYSNIFKPMRIGNMELKNRVVMVAMGIHDADLCNSDGSYTRRGIDYFIERAKGGVGLIVTGAMQVQNHFESDAHATTISIAGESYINGMKPLTEGVHKYGCKIVTQLTAGTGRQTPFWLTSGEPIASSDGLPNVWKPEVKHRALTPEEIQTYYVEGFRKGAVVAKEAGFDGIEIHAVHEGYLLDQFAIKSMNTRTDEYGGSVENRLRFCKEIIDAIHESCGKDFPVMMRYSVVSKMKNFNDGALPGEEFVEFGRDYEESIEVAKYLEKIGYAALDVDNGTYDSWFWPHPPVYMPDYCNLEDAAFIKKHVNVPVICAGKMADPDICEQAIADDKIDAIGLARILLADPQWANKAQAGKKDEIKPCIGCHIGCLGRLFQGKRMGCAINPQTGSEKELEMKKTENEKNIVVVGGGIAGMEAAKDLADRGHKVSLYEATDELGGAFIAASAMSFKEEDKKLITWYINETKKAGVEIHMKTFVTKELLDSLDPDEIIVATGATAKKLSGIEGIEKANIVDAIDVLRGKVMVGEKIVMIGGGLTGIEMAYDFVLANKQVEVLEVRDAILSPDVCMANSQMLKQIIKYHQIPIHTGAVITKLEDGKVYFTVNGEEKNIVADTIISSIGYVPNTALYDELKETYGNKVHMIGDSRIVSNLLGATWDAAELAVTL